jgi:hypothetical protein
MSKQSDHDEWLADLEYRQSKQAKLDSRKQADKINEEIKAAARSAVKHALWGYRNKKIKPAPMTSTADEVWAIPEYYPGAYDMKTMKSAQTKTNKENPKPKLKIAPRPLKRKISLDEDF